MPVTSQCRICLSYGYDWLSYWKWLRPPFLSIWQSSFGFFLDSSWIIFGHFRIDITSATFKLIWWSLRIFNWFEIDCFQTLSYWYDYDQNSRIEMTATSYWYEGKERGFFTLCYLSIRQSFFLSLIQKIWRSFAINERHFHRWNDRSFWVPKILSMGQ